MELVRAQENDSELNGFIQDVFPCLLAHMEPVEISRVIMIRQHQEWSKIPWGKHPKEGKDPFGGYK